MRDLSASVVKYFILGIFLACSSIRAYPPAVGILSKSTSCIACHISNGPWTDERRTIIDVLDGKTKRSLLAQDGSFLIEVRRGEARTVMTVIGSSKESPTPTRNGWLYVDPKQIGTSSLSKFAPGWDVNLPMACRIVGDEIDVYPGAHITVLPMTIRPMDAARNADLELQVMLSQGESLKGRPKEGLVSSYFVRKVKLQVLE
jgi:hypothetical protein